MTEADAQAQAQVAAIAPAAMPRLEEYAALLLAENRRQNLIAKSTESMIWQRHILDSLQLIRFARADDRDWLDIGSGAGLPGLVLAIADDRRVTLVESRRRRAAFLGAVATELALTNATVLTADVRLLTDRWSLVTARAVAGVSEILAMTGGCTDTGTRFILPKGRTAQHDVDLARRDWHGRFHVEQSLTDPNAGIVVAERVARR